MVKNYYPPELANQNDEAIMDFYADPENTKLGNYQMEEFNNNINLYKKEDFPKTALVVQTHATYYIPEDIRHSIIDGMQSILRQISPDGKEVLELRNSTKKEVFFLLKNYSDYKTRALLKNTLVPSDHIILHKLSRAFGDPNRPYKKNEVIISAQGLKKYIPETQREDYVLQEGERDWSLEFIREVDFGNISLFRDIKKYKEKWIDASDEYHGNIEKKLLEIEQWHWYSIMIDEHDTEMATGTLQGMLPRKEWFPLISLGDLNGQSCHPWILECFRTNFAKHLWIDEKLIVVNEPYNGWYTTIKHGMWYRQKLEWEWKNKNTRNVIQIEYGRFLFNNSRDQITDFKRAKFIWECRRRALMDVDRDIKSWKIDLWEGIIKK